MQAYLEQLRLAGHRLLTNHKGDILALNSWSYIDKICGNGPITLVMCIDCRDQFRINIDSVFQCEANRNVIEGEFTVVKGEYKCLSSH